MSNMTLSIINWHNITCTYYLIQCLGPFFKTGDSKKYVQICQTGMHARHNYYYVWWNEITMIYWIMLRTIMGE